MNKKILFLDESGDHDLKKISKEYPIFVLGGCIVDYDYNKETLAPRIKEFKRNFFGTEDVILHTNEIVRNKGVFECLKDSNTRERFYNEINSLLDKLDYTVVASVIKKEEFISKYSYPFDPYLLSLNFIIERFVYDLGGLNSVGEVIAESRGLKLDSSLRAEYNRILAEGTNYLSPKEIKEKIHSFNIKSKEPDLIGLQLADLIVSPIGRFILKKKIHKDFKIIENKIRRNPAGKYWGYGLKVFPEE